MVHETADIIDRLVDIKPGSRLDQIRAKRSQARENAEKSYLALFQPQDFGGFASRERLAIATFVTSLHREAAPTTFYGAQIEAADPRLCGGHSKGSSPRCDARSIRSISIGPAQCRG